jgi:ABC-2 type transport system ATP-binding protein
LEETVAQHRQQDTPPGARIRATGLGLHTRRGWVFRDVELDVAPGELVAVTGAAGSGRTSLLLAVAGRFAINRGSLSVAAHPLPRTAPAVQRLAALGLVHGAHEPEPALTVAEHVRERLALLGLGPWQPRRRRNHARELVTAAGFDLDPDALGRDLDPYRRQLLCLLLAELTAPRLIVVDDVDGGTDGVERAALWRVLRERADAGTTVLASCREVGDAPVDQAVRLSHRPAAVSAPAEPAAVASAPAGRDAAEPGAGAAPPDRPGRPSTPAAPGRPSTPAAPGGRSTPAVPEQGEAATDELDAQGAA